MTDVSAKELHIRTASVLTLIEKGEEVLITYRGVPYARMIPFQKITTRRKKEKVPAIGMWGNRADLSDPSAYVEAIRAPRQFHEKGDAAQ